MTLREQVHRSIDQLDDEALALVFEQLQALKRETGLDEEKTSVPSLEEVLEMTASDTSSWSDELIAEREDRI